MLSASVDFSSASSLLTIGVPAAGISGTGTKEEVSFSSILNAGDSAMALPEINVAAPGSVLPEENRIAAQVLSDAREITEETVATSRTLDFYDLSADSDDLSRKLYDVELSDADYELFDPLSREGEEFSAGDLSACLTPCHSEPSAIPVADILAGVRDLFSRRGFPESGLTSDDLGGAESGEMSPSDFGEQTDSETVPEIPEQAVISSVRAGVTVDIPEDADYVYQAVISDNFRIREVPGDYVVRNFDSEDSAAVSGDDLSRVPEASARAVSGDSRKKLSRDDVSDNQVLVYPAVNESALTVLREVMLSGESAVERAGESAVERAGESAGESAGERAGERTGERTGENAEILTEVPDSAVLPESGFRGGADTAVFEGPVSDEPISAVNPAAAPEMNAGDSRKKLSRDEISEVQDYIPEAFLSGASFRDTGAIEDTFDSVRIPEEILAGTEQSRVLSEEAHASREDTAPAHEKNAEIHAGKSAAGEIPSENSENTVGSRARIGESAGEFQASPDSGIAEMSAGSEGVFGENISGNAAASAQDAGHPEISRISDSGFAAGAEIRSEPRNFSQNMNPVSGDAAAIPEHAPLFEETIKTGSGSAFFSGREIFGNKTEMPRTSEQENTAAGEKPAVSARDTVSLSRITGLESIRVRSVPVSGATSGMTDPVSREADSAMAALSLLQVQKNVSTRIVSRSRGFLGAPDGDTSAGSGYLAASGEDLVSSSEIIASGEDSPNGGFGESGSHSREQFSGRPEPGMALHGAERSAGASAESRFGSFPGRGLSGTGQPASDSGNSGTAEAVRLFEGRSRENAEAIRDQVMRMAARNLRKVEIALTPERLGHLRIEVDMADAGKARVRFVVAGSEARELISQSMDRLRDSLAEAGINLEEHTVDQESGGESRGRERAEQEWENSLRRLARSGRQGEWQEIFAGVRDGISEDSGIIKFW